jgi:hypothetical protein
VGKRGAFALLADLLEAPHTRPLQAVLTLRKVLEEVNKRVSAYGFAIRTVRSDVDGKLFYAFVNTVRARYRTAGCRRSCCCCCETPVRLLRPRSTHACMHACGCQRCRM